MSKYQIHLALIVSLVYRIRKLTMLPILLFLSSFFNIYLAHSEEKRTLDQICQVSEEKRTLDQIYQAALSVDGGNLVVYAGGDSPTTQASTQQQFVQQFPGMNVQIVVDYSKFHGPRIDMQLANNSLIPDAVHLQTLQDFTRWKKQGFLLAYKPRGWSKVYRDFRDNDGFHTGFTVYYFSNSVNSHLMPNETDWPTLASDYLKPEFKGRKLGLVYPNDDDAILFLFKQIVDKYGWEWFRKFAEQDPILVRGNPASGAMLSNGSAMASPAGYGGAISQHQEGTLVRSNFPTDNDPFVTWAQQMAIFKSAKHVESAKLYMNWQLERQRNTTASDSIWSVRTDSPVPSGFKPIWDYPNSSHKKFAAFMEDREAVERFKAQIFLFIGEPQGTPSPGLLGPTPTESCQGASLTECQG